MKVGDLPPLDLQAPPIIAASCTPDLCDFPGPTHSTPIKSLPVPVPGTKNPDRERGRGLDRQVFTGQESSSMVPPITPETPNPLASSFMTPTSDAALQTDQSDTTESDVEKSTNGKMLF